MRFVHVCAGQDSGAADMRFVHVCAGQDWGAADMRLVHVCDGEDRGPFVRLGFICKGKPPGRDRLGTDAQACIERMPAAPSRLFSRMGVPQICVLCMSAMAKTGVPQICVLCMSATVRSGGLFVRLSFICNRRPSGPDRLGTKAQACKERMPAAPSRLFSRMGVPQICVLCMSAMVRSGGPSSASASSARVDPQNVIGSGSRRRHPHDYFPGWGCCRYASCACLRR